MSIQRSANGSYQSSQVHNAERLPLTSRRLSSKLVLCVWRTSSPSRQVQGSTAKLKLPIEKENLTGPWRWAEPLNASLHLSDGRGPHSPSRELVRQKGGMQSANSAGNSIMMMPTEKGLIKARLFFLSFHIQLRRSLLVNSSTLGIGGVSSAKWLALRLAHPFQL